MLFFTVKCFVFMLPCRGMKCAALQAHLHIYKGKYAKSSGVQPAEASLGRRHSFSKYNIIFLFQLIIVCFVWLCTKKILFTEKKKLEYVNAELANKKKNYKDDPEVSIVLIKLLLFLKNTDFYLKPTLSVISCQQVEIIIKRLITTFTRLIITGKRLKLK